MVLINLSSFLPVSNIKRCILQCDFFIILLIELQDVVQIISKTYSIVILKKDKSDPLYPNLHALKYSFKYFIHKPGVPQCEAVLTHI